MPFVHIYTESSTKNHCLRKNTVHYEMNYILHQ